MIVVCCVTRHNSSKSHDQAIWRLYTFAASSHLLYWAILSLISCIMCARVHVVSKHSFECRYDYLDQPPSAIPTLLFQYLRFSSLSCLPILPMRVSGLPPSCSRTESPHASPVPLPLAVHLAWTGMSGLMPLSRHACMLAVTHMPRLQECWEGAIPHAAGEPWTRLPFRRLVPCACPVHSTCKESGQLPVLDSQRGPQRGCHHDQSVCIPERGGSPWSSWPPPDRPSSPDHRPLPGPFRA